MARRTLVALLSLCIAASAWIWPARALAVESEVWFENNTHDTWVLVEANYAKPGGPPVRMASESWCIPPFGKASRKIPFQVSSVRVLVHSTSNCTGQIKLNSIMMYPNTAHFWKFDVAKAKPDYVRYVFEGPSKAINYP